MKPIIKKTILIVLTGFFLTSCNHQQMDYYYDNPPKLISEVEEYYNNLGITEDVRRNAKATYLTCDLRKSLQLRLPEYWEEQFLIEYSSLDNIDTIVIYDKYNYDYYYAHNLYAQQFQQKYGTLWTINIFSYDYYKSTHSQKFPDSCSEIIGANSIIIGSDEQFIYLLSLPTGVEFFAEDTLATNIYKTSMSMKDKIIEDFLKINGIDKNESAPHIN